MSHRIRLHPLAALAVLGLAPATTGAAQEPQAAATDTLQGTVQTVNPASGYVDVLTGVGLALRVKHVWATAETGVTVSGEQMPLDDLEPGDIVWVEYRPDPEGRLIARAIRKTGTMDARPRGNR
jgi:hypothetical protein